MGGGPDCDLEGLHPEGQAMLQLTGNRLHNEVRKGLTQSKQWRASELRWRPQEYRREGKSRALGRWYIPKTCYPDVDTNPAEF